MTDQDRTTGDRQATHDIGASLRGSWQSLRICPEAAAPTTDTQPKIPVIAELTGP